MIIQVTSQAVHKRAVTLANCHAHLDATDYTQHCILAVLAAYAATAANSILLIHDIC